LNDDAIYKASATYLQVATGYSEMRKRDSKFMWFLYAISFMWIWNRRFMDGFHTTIFGKIYWADGVREWRTLWHECMHRKQATRVGEPWFSVTYLFPQAVGIGIAVLLPAIIPMAILWTPHVLWLLLGLVTLGPWPAPWRVKYEREAYCISAVCDALAGVDITSAWYLNYQIENHCGWAYWKPAWGRAAVRKFVMSDIIRALEIVRGTEHGTEHTSYTDELLRIVKENR
jgi:hypothetical protein